MTYKKVNDDQDAPRNGCRSQSQHAEGADAGTGNDPPRKDRNPSTETGSCSLRHRLSTPLDHARGSLPPGRGTALVLLLFAFTACQELVVPL